MYYLTWPFLFKQSWNVKPINQKSQYSLKKIKVNMKKKKKINKIPLYSPSLCMFAIWAHMIELSAKTFFSFFLFTFSHWNFQHNFQFIGDWWALQNQINFCFILIIIPNIIFFEWLPDFSEIWLFSFFLDLFSFSFWDVAWFFSTKKKKKKWRG